MAISPKPKQSPTVSEKAVDALIHKGGSVAGSERGDGKDKVVPVVLRVPSDMLVKIDANVQTRAIKTPRNTWLLEAVLEKLQRESQ